VNAAIGIFDSGIGGLTVFQAIEKSLPGESFIYLGDTARVPYGTKSCETVTQYSRENTEFLIKHGVKAVVVACNTASAFAIKVLQDEFELPILGVIEPGAHEAVRISQSLRIGVLGTSGTVSSRAYEKAIKDLSDDAVVMSQACPLFVPLIEEGWINDQETESIARRYLAPLMEAEVDTIILGCTHYPLLKNVIQKIVGDGVQLVDARATAVALKNLLEEKGLLSVGAQQAAPDPEHQFYVTDSVERFERVGKMFLGKPLENVVKA
jgi:glutamate racemase